MARRQGGTLGGFTPLSTPNAPTDLSVSTSIGSAEVSFTAPADTGDGAVTSYIVTAIDESTGASFGATGSASPITVSPSPGGTFKIRAQAVNAFGPGRLTEFEAGNLILAGTAVYTWGSNDSGQIGDSSVASKSSPIQVGDLINWAKASAGYKHSAAIKNDGTLWTWGNNAFGQLGDNTIANKSSPIQVAAFTNWSQVATGGFIAGHTVAVTTGGTLYAWGQNSYGRLGVGDTVIRSSPVQIGALTNWSQVSTAPGGAHTLSVKTDSTLWAWGYNGAGQLGQGNAVYKSSPVQVGALTNWAQAAAGNGFSLAVTTGGALYAWGSNSQGPLGDGTVVRKSSPIQVGVLTNWAQVSAGSGNSAAVKTDGTLWGWGRNNDGQIGDSTGGPASTYKSSPVQIGALTAWSQVACGDSHVAAVRTDGLLYAWGNNANGQLGNSTTASRSSPVQVGAGANWAQVSAGTEHTVAITES